MSTLMFVPVPGGVRADDTAVLRVLVVPRLDSGSVSDNGLAAWPPAELRGPLQVTLTPDGGAPVQLDVTPRLVDQPGLWTSVFGAATVAARPSWPLAATPTPAITVRPTSRLASQVDDTYRTAAQSIGAPIGPDHTALDDAGTDAYAATVAMLLRRAEWATPPAPRQPAVLLDAAATAPPTTAPSDVDRIYGTLREHPRVLAALGLLFELDVPLASVPAGVTGVVSVDWAAATTVSPPLPTVTPRSTAYLRDVFLPAPQTDAYEAGVVRLDDPAQWEVAAVDVDGAVARLQAGAAASNATAGGSTAATLPALRTAGLMLLRPGRAADFAARRARVIAHGAEPDPVLTAEDLVLGYRIDVRTFGDTTWQPLCARLATYHVDGALVAGAAAFEEGHVKAHAAVRDETGQLSADEIVTRWDGWSLAVPLPFPPLVAGDAPGTDPTALAGTGLPYTLDVDLSVPDGTLPALRFGPSYEFRARVADVAGGGLTVDDPTADRNGSSAYPFRRYEPVASPTLQLPDGVTEADLGPGVHVAQLVVSSAGGSPAATTLDPTALDPTEPTRARRTLTRPTVTLTTAEWHGALTGDADATWPAAQLALVGDLPDPAADGVAAYIVAAPGTPATGPSGHRWPAWPDPTGAAVEVRGHPASVPTPTLSWQGSTLVVDLPPAGDVTVQVSSTITPEDVAHFAVGGWSNDVGVGAATTGRHPMLTPPVEFRCVHAVRRPLEVPSGGLTATRAPGLVPVTVTPAVPLFGIDPASTGQVELTASWTEVTDDVRTEVVDHPVQPFVVNRGDIALAEPLRHLLPDTRHRTVTYSVTAVSRFRSWFTDGTDDDYTSTSTPAMVEVPNTVRPAAPVVLAVTPSFVWERTAGPTITRVRRGNRIRVELDRPWYSSGDDERLVLVLTPAAAGIRGTRDHPGRPGPGVVDRPPRAPGRGRRPCRGRVSRWPP